MYIIGFQQKWAVLVLEGSQTAVHNCVVWCVFITMFEN